MKTKQKIGIFLQALFIAYALQLRLEEVPLRENFKSMVHYLYAVATTLLGEYSINSIFIGILAIVLLVFCSRDSYEKLKGQRVLAVFFAASLLIGRAYREPGSLAVHFGSVFKVVRFLPALLGYSFLLYALITLFMAGYEKLSMDAGKAGFWVRFLGQKSFRNVFLLLLVLWAPILLLSYPGNLCYDCLGQISMGLGEIPYSTHHPLLHTLLVSGFIKLGHAITGSNDPGLFVYVLLQAAALAAALAATMQRLMKRSVSLALRKFILGIYVLAPMYSNIASTAVKDVPFMAALIWYLLLLEEAVWENLNEKKTTYYVRLVFVGALVGLFRNNGIYVVVLSGICFAIALAKTYRGKKAIILFLCLTVLPFGVYKGTGAVLKAACHAEKGSEAEMLSIPFQQTARYLQLYRAELTAEEKTAIENVLTDVELVAANYNPNISDPVKALYVKNAGGAALAQYLKVWAAQLCNHPAVYFDAFFAHVYGWFDPGAQNSIRYEAESTLFEHAGLFNGADKLVLFIYRFVEYIPFLAILDNVGIYVWLLFLLAVRAGNRKDEKRILLVPLFVSLLICMAAPCFYLHPRYAFPIMFTIPFLYGVLSCKAGRSVNFLE